MKSRSHNLGQTMIEVVVGIGVVVILAISLVTTSLITQKTARSARNSTQATKLAQQIVEELRVFRDRKGFIALGSGTYSCIKSADSDPKNWSLVLVSNQLDCSSTPISDTLFTAEIKIIDDQSTNPVIKKKVEVVVSWPESGGMQQVKHQTFLTLWETPSSP